MREKANVELFKSTKESEDTMLSWAVLFLIIALIAGLLGFTGIAGTSVWIAQVLFVVSLLFRRRPPAA
jgi:uncharacterized membrane protein YtjA (UPF0391 family)